MYVMYHDVTLQDAGWVMGGAFQLRQRHQHYLAEALKGVNKVVRLRHYPL